MPAKIKKSKIVFVTLMCVTGAAILPAQSLLESGSIDRSTLAISLLTLVVGISVASIVLWLLHRRGSFLHYEIKDD